MRVSDLVWTRQECNAFIIICIQLYILGFCKYKLFKHTVFSFMYNVHFPHPGLPRMTHSITHRKNISSNVTILDHRYSVQIFDFLNVLVPCMYNVHFPTRGLPGMTEYYYTSAIQRIVIQFCDF